ncbi:SPOR domain-containing protein [Flavivirga aquimarina]|uniref:SPOR domain-containing protein n=1 Tax=Flavivirga aquimarina TaxID=2027862 RepID=A0ABT8WH50_9FLAO|nr:SPOR domain-containing protein [Flavivirga aquimarina]MDO5972460.1 SPOR domain-containing protein [Flavivirga aquimarina]
MKSFNLKNNYLSIFCFVITSIYCFGQQGNVTINQDKNITALLDIKKTMNKEVNNSKMYKIQIYSGNHRSNAKSAQTEFSNSFSNWRPTIQYEPPNFKIWAGNFRTRLEADRALKKIKRKFPNAFIFKPKKKKS